MPPFCFGFFASSFCCTLNSGQTRNRFAFCPLKNSLLRGLNPEAVKADIRTPLRSMLMNRRPLCGSKSYPGAKAQGISFYFLYIRANLTQRP